MDLLIAMAPQGGEGGSMVSTIIMFGAIFLIFYFMIIRPQQKKSKQREKLLSNLEKGDKVVTSGGIHGIISWRSLSFLLGFWGWVFGVSPPLEFTPVVGE